MLASGHVARLKAMSWDNDSRFTETSEGNSRSLIGVTFGNSVREGDSYTLTFEDNGETVTVSTRDGSEERVAFDVTFEEAEGFTPRDGDDAALDGGEAVRLMTGSSRFLSVLKDHMPVEDKTLHVHIDGTGYDAAYRIQEL